MSKQTLIYGVLIPALIFGISFLITYLLYKKFVKETKSEKESDSN